MYKNESLMDVGYFYAPYMPLNSPVLDPKFKEDEMTKVEDAAVLRERDPETAEFVDAWRAKYERTFDLSDTAQQATFYEGMLEMSRHVATAAGTVSLAVRLSTDGVSQICADAVPRSNEGQDDV